MDNPFLEYLNKLKSKATGVPTHKKYSQFQRYYRGNVAPTIGYGTDNMPIKGTENSFYNIVKPIIETKATTALDAMITTNVKPARLSHQTFDNLKQLENIADILNDCWENVKKNTDMSSVSQRIIRDGLINGIGIGKVFWNQSVDNGLGDVRVERVNPLDFYPEPGATTIENCNYIFVKRSISRFDLINEYKNRPEVLKKIDKLTTESSRITDSAEKRTDLVISMENQENGTTNSQQSYMNEGSLVPSNTTENIVLWECYLKDDTVLVPLDDDDPKDQNMKTEERFKYPNGRLIIYSEKEILEDRPIDYPFGFPFETFSPTQSDSLVGFGDVEDLISTQDKIIDAYYKLQQLLMKYKSFLIVQEESIPRNTLEKNFDIVYSVPGSSGTPPVLVTNKLTNDIQIVRQHIQDLKNDAYKIARINEIMLSGERPVGVNSGQMVRDLIESPMSSIREIQRNFKNFLTGISNKAITLIQLYYNQPRIIRMSSGTQFASIQPDEMGQMQINIYDRDMQTDQLMAIETIKSDLTLGEYEVEVTAGSSLPQSQSAIAATTMQLAQQGIFGDINDPDVKELILRTLDYPNYRAIINKIKEEQEQQAQVPIPEPDFNNYIQKVNMSLKDILELVAILPPEQQYSAITTITESLGIIPSVAPQISPNETNIAEATGIPSYITGIG
jgi:hypothetical protein